MLGSWSKLLLTVPRPEMFGYDLTLKAQSHTLEVPELGQHRPDTHSTVHIEESEVESCASSGQPTDYN